MSREGPPRAPGPRRNPLARAPSAASAAAKQAETAPKGGPGSRRNGRRPAAGAGQPRAPVPEVGARRRGREAGLSRFGAAVALPLTGPEEQTGPRGDRAVP